MSVVDAFDVVGVGFGPSNLGLAIAVEERNVRDKGDLSALFIEAGPKFGWHDHMLLPGTTMQISYLKDLVSQRTPTSEYSFVNYLHSCGRLTDFINMKTFFPTRQEFHDYLSWAAERVAQSVSVQYGQRVCQIDYADAEYQITTSACGDRAELNDPPAGVADRSQRVIRARNVVFGAGIRPALPPGATPGARVFHNHQLLAKLDELPELQQHRFVVVGAGQSAAEVVAYLLERYPKAEVHLSIRGYGLTPSDDTPYANRIFDPGAVDEFYTAPDHVKSELLARHATTNYTAVDAELIEFLYRHEYAEKVQGHHRLFTHRVTDAAVTAQRPDDVDVKVTDRGGRNSVDLKADAVIFATGFTSHSVAELFGPTVDTAGTFDDLGRPLVDRDYRLRTPDGSAGGVYLNGGVEHSHGLTSSLLSNIAIRSDEILAAITQAQSSPQAASADPTQGDKRG